VSSASASRNSGGPLIEHQLLYYELSAGPAGQPSHLITAEMLAPRATFSGGVAGGVWPKEPLALSDASGRA